MDEQNFELLALHQAVQFNLHCQGYNMIRLDRNRSGGGVCTYIRSCINYTGSLDLEIQFFEMLTLKTPKTLPMGSVIVLPKLVQVFLQTFPGHP